jgi:hypothetical protein
MDLQTKRGAVYAQTNGKRAHGSHLRLQNALKTKRYHPSNCEEASQGEKPGHFLSATHRELQLLHIVFSPPAAKCSSSANYSPAIGGSPRSSHDIRLIIVKQPVSESPSALNPGQSGRQVLGRVTSTKSDLFLPISSYIDTVTQVDGTF